MGGQFPVSETDCGRTSVSGGQVPPARAGVPAPVTPFLLLAAHPAVELPSAPGAPAQVLRSTVGAPALTVRPAAGLRGAFGSPAPTLPATGRFVAPGVDVPARIAPHCERSLYALVALSPDRPPAAYALLPNTPSAGGAPELHLPAPRSGPDAPRAATPTVRIGRVAFHYDPRPGLPLCANSVRCGARQAGSRCKL